MTQPKELLTSAEVAARLHRTPACVRLWARTGRLQPAVQTKSGLRLFSPVDVDALARAMGLA